MDIIKIQLKRMEVELLILMIREFLEKCKNKNSLDRERLELLLERLELYIDNSKDDIFEL